MKLADMGNEPQCAYSLPFGRFTFLTNPTSLITPKRLNIVQKWDNSGAEVRYIFKPATLGRLAIVGFVTVTGWNVTNLSDLIRSQLAGSHF